tara:strand:- start:7401 stop:9473 length:2073 start_codon:yes stop_codon:yes gene_type:complete
MMHARDGGLSHGEALADLLAQRSRVIANEKADPYAMGWEPMIWKVADALWDCPTCLDGYFLKQVKNRLDLDWDGFKYEMRKFLGFSAPVRLLFILGGNRSGKSEYSAKRGQLVLNTVRESVVAAFHMSNPRSVRDQQPLFWKYMPPSEKVQRATVSDYIKYKKKTGFSDNSFINSKQSECDFLNYAQDRDTALEGREDNLMLPDELVPPDWIETMLYRVTTRGGAIIVGFTPINGYTPTVKIAMDGAKVMRWSTAFALPRDGGEPDMPRTLGLQPSDWDELLSAVTEKRPAEVAQSNPEDCISWLEGKPSQVPVPEDRMFHQVPRVMRGINQRVGILFFHSGDNPYGNPKEVVQESCTKGATDRKIRLYGLAEKTSSSIFAKFKPAVHVVPASAIPKSGTNTMLMDPATDRNSFLSWIRATSTREYLYREWPGNYEIPGVGVPDPWTVPTGKKEGRNDGAKGGGQETFGYGLYRYKFEIARLERWESFLRWFRDEGGPNEEAAMRLLLDGNLYPRDALLDSWDERDGAEEPVDTRIVDSRAANTPRMENDRPVTLFEDLEEIGLFFQLAPGSSIVDGVSQINTALDYTQDEKLSFVNHPRFMASEECLNTIYSLETWLNVDGDKGACKDPLDNLRYYYTSEAGYVDEGAGEAGTGFYYGRGSTSRRADQGFMIGQDLAGVPKRGTRAQWR